MGATIQTLLGQKEESHLLPFLWIHGEPHDVYRKMVKAIYDANIRAFCVEARPHKEFGRQQWWEDMECILSEAEKYGMRVWILDDKHFPTGYANGGVEKAPVERRRQHMCNRQVMVQGGKRVKLGLARLLRPQNSYNAISRVMLLMANDMKPPRKYRDDKLLSCTAWAAGSVIDLMPHIQNGTLVWDAPAGEWTVEVCSLSRDTGMHRNYINMLDKASCRIQIDEVYEPHYQHFKDRFATTIAGFFSDEPELGNGNYTKHYNLLGTPQSLPYSQELAAALEQQLGAGWKSLMPLLWKNDYSKQETARVRYIYMDCVTRLAEQDFSRQMGEWCNERGVEYIGHVIEDNNQHARTSTSLGHYFRGLKYQNMAGIDDIGGQVQPGGEDLKKRFVFGYDNDGEFYHYALGKLGSSLGAINPRMQGRTMCEIFGNYGWSEGVRLEKYLVDHFMVRGVNTFVPHAFNSKAYPDKDCPPHFYAHGHNPQYRHFGKLMQYTNRICALLSGGQFTSPVAILYHGEAEWAGECMLMQKPARILQDNQIDFNFLPTDVFAEQDFYRTEITDGELRVNGRTHRLLVVPYAQFIPLALAQGIVELQQAGCGVAFVDALPEGISTGEALPQQVLECDVVPLAGLLRFVEALGLREVTLQPQSNRMRCMHYLGEQELFYLVNEGAARYEGTAILPVQGSVYEYDAWDNRLYEVAYTAVPDGVSVQFVLEPGKAGVIVAGNPPGKLEQRAQATGTRHPLTSFTRSVCRSIEYPRFTKAQTVHGLESYSDTDKRFSGFIRYETSFALEQFDKAVVEITDAYEGVELFVNEKSAGIQVAPPFLFDITELGRPGENKLAIEVATTLERERSSIKNAAPTGITGQVNLYTQ